MIWIVFRLPGLPGTNLKLQQNLFHPDRLTVFSARLLRPFFFLGLISFVLSHVCCLLQKIRFFFCFPSANRDFDVFPVSGLFYGTCGMNQKRNPHFVLCLCLKGWCSNPLLPVNILSDHSLREAVPLQGLLKNTGVGSSLQSPQTVCFKTFCLQMLLSRFVFRLIFIFGSRSFSALSTRKPAY